MRFGESTTLPGSSRRIGDHLRRHLFRILGIPNPHLVQLVLPPFDNGIPSRTDFERSVSADV